MLRRDCLRLVAAALGLILVACGSAPLQDSDAEPLSTADVRQGRALLGSGDVAGASSYWQGLLEQHPGSWEAHRGVQDTLRAMLSPVEFEEAYRTRREQQPDDAMAWYLWGRARIDHTAEAQEAFERAAALAPLSPWPVAGLAYLPWRAGDLFLTVQTYEEALERMPRSAKLRLLLGNQFLSLRLMMDAQRHLEMARRLDPDNPVVLAALGKVYVEIDRKSAGVALLEESLQREPDMADAVLALAEVYLGERRVDEAEAMYRRSLELGMPRDDELHGAIRAARLVEEGRR